MSLNILFFNYIIISMGMAVKKKSEFRLKLNTS